MLTWPWEGTAAARCATWIPLQEGTGHSAARSVIVWQPGAAVPSRPAPAFELRPCFPGQSPTTDCTWRGCEGLAISDYHGTPPMGSLCPGSHGPSDTHCGLRFSLPQILLLPPFPIVSVRRTPRLKLPWSVCSLSSHLSWELPTTCAPNRVTTSPA